MACDDGSSTKPSVTTRPSWRTGTMRWRWMNGIGRSASVSGEGGSAARSWSGRGTMPDRLWSRWARPAERPSPNPGIFRNICSNALALNFAATTSDRAVTVAVRVSQRSRPTSPMLLGCGARPSSRLSPPGPSTETVASPVASTKNASEASPCRTIVSPGEKETISAAVSSWGNELGLQQPEQRAAAQRENDRLLECGVDRRRLHRGPLGGCARSADTFRTPAQQRDASSFPAGAPETHGPRGYNPCVRPVPRAGARRGALGRGHQAGADRAGSAAPAAGPGRGACNGFELVCGSKQASLGELIAARKYARAIEVLRAQFRGGARDPRLRLQLADVLALAGRPKEAAPILSALADEYAREGYAAKAIAVLKKLQKVAPGQPDVERRLAELLHGRLRPAEPPARPEASAYEPAAFEFGMEEIGSDDAGDDAGRPPSSRRPRWPCRPPARRGPSRSSSTRSRTSSRRARAPPRRRPPSRPRPRRPSRPVPSPLFGGFSEDELRAVIARLRLLSFEPGDIVVTEGQPGDSLFVLTTGVLKAFVRDQGGRNVPVREMPEGSFFGEISMLCERPRSATVTCATHCEMLALDRAAFDEIVAEHPHVRQVVQETYEARAGSLEEMLAREGWDGTPPPAPDEPGTPAR